MLTPLGRLIGDPDFGSVSQALLGTGEGALFGFGLALGSDAATVISRTSHNLLSRC